MKFKRLFPRFFILILSIILLFVLPKIGIKANEDINLIYSIFVGEKSKYQGVIEVWNIDTFEGGKVSKTNILKDFSLSFQKYNKGTYVLVKNMSENECKNLLASGKVPDLFSCSYGVLEGIKDYIVPFENMNQTDIRKEFLEAGKVGNELYGLAWCRGVYCLITTKDKVQKAGKDVQTINLINDCLDLSYEIKNKNQTKIINSIEIGQGSYLMPKNALLAYNKSGINSLKLESIDRINQTQYSAYTNFLAGKSTVLLGTQKDILRIEGKVKNGKMSDVIYYPLTKFCDLVQFLFISKNNDKLKQSYAEKLALFYAGEICQSKLVEYGLFPVNMANYKDLKSDIMCDIAPQINEDLIVYNVFLTKKEIDNFR